jgi:Glu-tRNA(Gln) amidotransferase subunit E-like FAD-binding protein
LKAAIIMLCIVAVVIALNAFTACYINNSSEKLLSYVNEAREAASKGDIEAIHEQVNKLRDEWEVYESRWEMLVDHREIDRIDTLVTHLQAMAAAGALEDLIPELEELAFFITHIDDKHKIRAENIL